MLHSEKFINKNIFGNTKIPYLDRTITIEGNGGFSNKELLKSQSIVETIEKSCIEISKHINSIYCEGHPMPIHSMKLLFKQDIYDRICLLLCSSIKIDKSIGFTPLRIFDENPRYVKYEILSENFNNLDENENFSEKSKQINTREFKCKRCVICLNSIPPRELLHEISNKTAIEMHEFSKKSPLKQQSFAEPYFELTGTTSYDSDIPKIIQNLYPGITYKQYEIKKDDPIFQFETSRVCENCYISIKKLYFLHDSLNPVLAKKNKKNVN